MDVIAHDIMFANSGKHWSTDYYYQRQCWKSSQFERNIWWL